MDGKRGACEIGSCVIQYIRSLPPTVQHVTMFSDCCGGQNRNKHILTAILYALQMCPHITTIDHKFLQSLHTESEVDSVHASIERRAKHVNVYSPRDW